jgi:hypothetical protein
MCIDSYVWEPNDDMITELIRDTQTILSQILEEYQHMATSERSEAHSSKRKYFHLGDFHEDSQVKRRCFSTPEHVPYLLPSSPRDHAVFFRSLISSQSSTSCESLCADEDEPSSTYSTPLQRWIDQACGYHFMQDSLHDQSGRYSFQQDFLPPTHLHEFHFTIDYKLCVDKG